MLFQGDDICAGMWAEGQNGQTLMCETMGPLQPLYVPGCGCGCEEAQTCNGIEAWSLDEEVCDTVNALGTMVGCGTEETAWALPGCGCGCYIAPESVTPVYVQAHVIEEEECPPSGGELAASSSVEVGGQKVCDMLQADSVGGLQMQCDEGMVPFFMGCGCGCAPEETDSSELFSGDTTVDRVSRALNGQVSLSSVLLLMIAVFAVYQGYNCWVGKSSGDSKVERVGRYANYQTI